MSNDVEVPLIQLEETAVEAARAAGSVLLQLWHEAREVRHKGEIDLVTDADDAAERVIVSLIRSRFPDHRILAEEGSSGGNSESYRWVIDPLDGTTNYAHGYPHFAVSIAVERDGVPVAAAVYDPTMDELFHGRAGHGAYAGGTRLQVSAVDRMLDALVASGFPYDRARIGPVLDQWGYFARRCQALRRTGSAALDLCYVAAGRFDAYWESGLHEWDCAAGVLLVREAGGVVSSFSGEEADLTRGEILATNGHLHPSMAYGLACAVRTDRLTSPDGAASPRYRTGR